MYCHGRKPNPKFNFSGHFTANFPENTIRCHCSHDGIQFVFVKQINKDLLECLDYSGHAFDIEANLFCICGHGDVGL